MCSQGQSPPALMKTEGLVLRINCPLSNGIQDRPKKKKKTVRNLTQRQELNKAPGKQTPLGSTDTDCAGRPSFRSPSREMGSGTSRSIISQILAKAEN